MTNKIEMIELGMRNFFSYGNNTSVINLNRSKPTLIIGKNYDSAINGMIDSNGAGKSTILNGIIYSLYGKTVGCDDADGVINDINKKDLEVYLIFKSNNIKYKITRYRKNKQLGGNGVKFIRYDVDDNGNTIEIDETPEDAMKKTNAFQKIIGMPFDVFVRIYVFSATHKPFLSLPTTSAAGKENQSDFLEELCGFTEISEKADKINEAIKLTKQNIVLAKKDYDNKIDIYNMFNNDIASLEQSSIKWENDNKNRLADISKDFVEDIDAIIDTNQKQKNKKQILDKINQLELFINKKKVAMNEAISAKSKHDDWNENKKNTVEKFQKFKNENASKYTLAMDLFDQTLTINALENEINICKIKNQNNDTRLASLLADRKKIKHELKHLSDEKCPYCSQHYVSDIHSIDNKNLDLVGVNGLILDVNKNIESLSTQIETNLLKIKNINEDVIKNGFDSIDDLKKFIKDYSYNISKLEEALASNNPFVIKDTSIFDVEIKQMNDELKLLQESMNEFDGIDLSINYDDKIKRHESALLISKTIKESKNPYIDMLENKKINTPVEPSSGDIDSMTDDLEHMTFLYKLLTKKDSFIRKALLQKYLPFLNTKLKQHLASMGMNHKISFEEDMSVNISKFGTGISYDLLSSGQKARVNLALSFAFRDVLQLRFGVVNFCILDEALDVGLGAVGVQMAAKLIKEIGKTNGVSVMVISHRDEVQSMFDERIEIELKNGFSNIIDNN